MRIVLSHYRWTEKHRLCEFDERCCHVAVHSGLRGNYCADHAEEEKKSQQYAKEIPSRVSTSICFSKYEH